MKTNMYRFISVPLAALTPSISYRLIFIYEECSHTRSHVSLILFLFFRQYPTTSHLQTQTGPVTSQASQQHYQAVSLSQSLAFPPPQTGSVTQGLSTCVAPFRQPFQGETFAIVSHAKPILETLKEENQSLKLELHKQNEKASKLQQVLVGSLDSLSLYLNYSIVIAYRK